MSRFTECSQTFLAWWKHALYAGVPKPLRKWVHINQPHLILRIASANEVDVIWQQANIQSIRGHLLLNDALKVDLNYFVPKEFIDKPYYVDLRLDKQQVLFFQKLYPESLKDNLSQAIRYQIDRLTPFKADEVYFDVHVNYHNRKQKKILSDIFVAPRKTIEALIAQLRDKGIYQLDAISVADTVVPVSLTFDGMPNRDLHPDVSHKPLYFILLALLISLTAPIAYQHFLLSQVEAEIADLRESAAEQLAIRDKLYEAEQALAFLKEKRSSSPMVLDVVEILSKEIPHNTWLKRLDIKDKTLEIRGESEKALALIDVLEESSSFSQVRFNSPVALNKKNKRDKFYIQAILEVPHG
jgi:general secretion pathway protein L